LTKTVPAVGCEPGGEFYLRPHLGVDEATVTAPFLPADGFGGA